MSEDGGTVLSTHVPALSVHRGRVVGAVEELDELPILDYGRIKIDFQGLSMIGCPIAHFSVCRILSALLTASVSDACLKDALVLRRRIFFQEYVLDTPKTTSGEYGSLASNRSIYR